jgi:hypothetical protein
MTEAKPMSRTKAVVMIVLFPLVMFLWSWGLAFGFLLAPFFYGFKLGMRESMKLWKYPDEFLDT